MGVSAKRGSSKTITYTLTGKTLAELVKEIEKKGPVDPNESKRYAGKCRGRLDLKLEAKDLDYAVSGSGGRVEAEVWLKSGSVAASCEITLPKLASDKPLSADAKKEWTRFAAAVQKHEEGHFDAYFAEAQALAKELDGFRAKGSGATEKAAKAAAAQALLADLKAKYGGTVLDDRMKASAKAYDAKTKHGETQGASLDGTIA